MKYFVLVSLALGFLGCSKSEDKAAVASPVVALPPIISPTCTTHLYSNNGSLGGPPPKSTQVIIRSLDLGGGDTLVCSYKKWNDANWSTFRPGYYSDVTFSVNGETVTITNIVNEQFDWAIAATIKECS